MARSVCDAGALYGRKTVFIVAESVFLWNRHVESFSLLSAVECAGFEGDLWTLWNLTSCLIGMPTRFSGYEFKIHPSIGSGCFAHQKPLLRLVHFPCWNLQHLAGLFQYSRCWMQATIFHLCVWMNCVEECTCRKLTAMCARCYPLKSPVFRRGTSHVRRCASCCWGNQLGLFAIA